MDRYIVVLVGGAVGSLARFLVGTAIMTKFTGRFPFGTGFINITGAFLIGFGMTFLTARSDINPNWRLLLITGFLGGYTTFSGYEYEIWVLARQGERLLGFIYGAGSLVVGYGAVWLGALAAGKR